ncbi:MAG: TIGR02281 family clan AA aspartic protease [Burkholderiales bacterium]
MKIDLLIPLLAILVAIPVWAQERIYRCGTEYTNTVTESQAKNCKLISSDSEREVIIQRGKNGHFQVSGKVNGQAALFLVDTGASFVSISNELATAAKIVGGEPITLQTANGSRAGRLVRNVSIVVGNVMLTSVAVSVGLAGGAVDEVLLGQSALSKFEMSVVGNKMVLRRAH